MKNLTDKKLELLDAMLDDRIEMYGVINTIQYLLDNDFTKEELLEMKFDEVDINEAIKEDTEDALNSLLMWSHYADEHRGYCIKYKLSKHFIKQDENDSFEHMFLKPIIYRKDEDKVDISEMTTINTDLAFATKHESWGYENEVRLIVYNPNKEDAFYGIPLDKDS